MRTLLHSTKEPQPLNREWSSSYLSLAIPTPPLNCQPRAQPTQILSPGEHRYPARSLWGSQSIQYHRTYKAEWRWPLRGRAAAQVSSAEVPSSYVRVLDTSGQSGANFNLGLKLPSFQALDSLFTCLWVTVSRAENWLLFSMTEAPWDLQGHRSSHFHSLPSNLTWTHHISFSLPCLGPPH